MKQFLPEDLVQFLQKTDEFLSEECSLIVIGGAAASLAYGVTKTTTDIDLATAPPEHLKIAIDLARKDTGMNMPVSYVGVFEPPYCFEDRLSVLKKPALNKLNLLMPERHDLALMKVVRGYENDIQAIVEIHHSYPLDPAILIERFMEEMSQVNGSASNIRLNFLLMIESLFSKEEVANAEQVTGSWKALLVEEQAKRASE